MKAEIQWFKRWIPISHFTPENSEEEINQMSGDKEERWMRSNRSKYQGTRVVLKDERAKYPNHGANNTGHEN